MTRQARRGAAWPGKVRQGMAGKARRGMAGQGEAGEAWHGEALQGEAWHGRQLNTVSLRHDNRNCANAAGA